MTEFVMFFSNSKVVLVVCLAYIIRAYIRDINRFFEMIAVNSSLEKTHQKDQTNEDSK